MDSVLNIEVSCFKNYDTAHSPKSINLLKWLRSDKYRYEVERIRSIENKADRDKLKEKLPGITPSGLCSYRAEKNHTKHSGLIQFDIDLKGNEHIGNYADLKKHICNIPNVAYCGLSVSGKGYWGLIPIAYPDKHKLHFAAMEAAFAKLGIKIDPAPANVASLRGYSYDANGYFNHSATIFKALPKPRLKPVRATTGAITTKPLEIITKKVHNAPDGEKHCELLKAARLAGGYIAGGQINESTAIEALENAIKSRDINCFATAQKTIKYGINCGKQHPIEQQTQAA